MSCQKGCMLLIYTVSTVVKIEMGRGPCDQLYIFANVHIPVLFVKACGNSMANHKVKANKQLTMMCVCTSKLADSVRLLSLRSHHRSAENEVVYHLASTVNVFFFCVCARAFVCVCARLCMCST
uniref:Uncharacterized protein n=1 Tax=Trypanosoma vivax (strain Y486) TaxID=1055687 RepID=G0U2Y1_TRYVY|nr:conserved hypothetical protein [Trypanosoma vivax Y486]